MPSPHSAIPVRHAVAVRPVGLRTRRQPGIDLDGQTGLLYTPASCAGGTSRKLIVALHGCLTNQELIGDTFADDPYLNQYAATSNPVVLYPQALATLVPLSPEACWDWYGYTGPGYAIHGAPQMVIIMNMVHALRG